MNNNSYCKISSRRNSSDLANGLFWGPIWC